MTVYFEDVTVGDTVDLGSFTVSDDDIVSFAERYDPQPIHVDPAAARETPFGGLVASGWHTAAETMRVLVDGFLADAAAVGARGVDELRWPSPLRPGDEVSVTAAVRATRPSESSPERGLVRLAVTGETAAADAPRSSADASRGRSDPGDQRTVISYVALVLFARRDA